MDKKEKNFEQSEEAPDMKGKEIADRPSGDSLATERQEREKAKADAKPAKKGEMICITDLKADGKRYKRGDVYDGKMFAGIEKSLMTKSEWENR